MKKDYRMGIYPNMRIASAVARMDSSLYPDCELRLKPYPQLECASSITMYVPKEFIEDQRHRGLEIKSYWTHYDVKLTEDQRESLEIIKRG